jgi:hypothetical protein
VRPVALCDAGRGRAATNETVDLAIGVFTAQKKSRRGDNVNKNTGHQGNAARQGERRRSLSGKGVTAATDWMSASVSAGRNPSTRVHRATKARNGFLLLKNKVENVRVTLIGMASGIAAGLWRVAVREQLHSMEGSF